MAHLADHPELRPVLGLSHVPHFTTLQKASRKLLAEQSVQCLPPAWNARRPAATSCAVGIPYQSGADGVFEWTWAPDDEVFYNISGKGLPYVPARPFTAGKGEQVVKLPIGQDVRKLLEQQRAK